jgi:xanthine dehydrogenase YagR molybdenum-binding subunit
VAGVLRVLTHENAPTLRPTPRVNPLNMATMVAGTSVNYLNTDQVHFDGQPVAVVVAETPEAAQYAAGLVEVAYEPRPAAVDLAAEQGDATPVRGLPVGPSSGRADKGDAAAALAAAPYRVDSEFTTPGNSHNAIEPHSTTASWDGDRLTVHEASQQIDWLRKHLAVKFGVPVAAVRVISEFTGGGFGGKGSVWAGTVLAAMAARAVGRPVRLMLSREGVYRTVGGRTPSIQRVALGSGPDGRLTALIHSSVTRVGRVGGMPEQVTSCSRDLYAAQNITVDPRTVELDLLPNTFMRAPGESIGTFALESSMDELAGALGLDPIELRIRNEPARHPLDGRRFSRHGVRQALQRGAEVFGWSARDPRPGSMRDGEHLVGWGVAAAIHPAWEFPANVALRVDEAGGVLLRCGFHEIGVGASTAVAQMTAYELGVPVQRVRVEHGDTEQPTAPGAGGSAQTASIAAGVQRAAEKLRDALYRLDRAAPDSPLRGARRAAVRLRDGGLHGPAGGTSVVEILRRAGRTELTVRVGADSGLGALAGQARFMGKLVRDGRRWAKAASGAQFCEVRVDPDTGEVRVSRWVGVFDVGRVVNAKLVASQLRGGIVMGLGLALSEATLVDPRNGRIMNPSLAEYHVPVHADVPPIVVETLDHPDPTMPLGVLGAGEVGITGVAAAVANAVHHATGRRIRDLPITLDAVLP